MLSLGLTNNEMELGFTSTNLGFVGYDVSIIGYCRVLYGIYYTCMHDLVLWYIFSMLCYGMLLYVSMVNVWYVIV